MNIVIDIEEKVNSEIASCHISREEVTNALCQFSKPYDKLCKLYVTDDIVLANEYRSKGNFVIPVINDTNSHLDFSGFKYLITDSDEIDEDFYYKIWQRYTSLPWHILDTDRCIVREMTLADVSSLYDIYEDSSVTKYTEPLFPDYEDEIEYTHNYIHNVYEYFGFGTWVVIRKSDNKIIGRAGYNFRPGYDIPELGYVFGSNYQHNGYASEVCSALIKYGFCDLEFDQILAFSSPDNLPSIRLLNRLGFASTSSIAEPSDIQSLGFRLQAFVLSK